MTAKTVKNLAAATLFLAVCLSSGCAEQPSPQSTNNDDVITPEYSPPEEGIIGGGPGSKTCVLTDLQPNALYEFSYEVQLSGGGGYVGVIELRTNASGEVEVPNVPAEVDCNKIEISLKSAPTPQPPIAGMPPEGE